jgi:hypothetical protein
LLVAALVTLLLAVAAAPRPYYELRWHLAGYLLGSLGTIGCVVWFRRVDTSLRSHPGYLPDKRLLTVSTVLLLCSFGPTAWHAYSIATVIAS